MKTTTATARQPGDDSPRTGSNPVVATIRLLVVCMCMMTAPTSGLTLVRAVGFWTLLPGFDFPQVHHSLVAGTTE